MNWSDFATLSNFFSVLPEKFGGSSSCLTHIFILLKPRQQIPHKKSLVQYFTAHEMQHNYGTSKIKAITHLDKHTVLCKPLSFSFFHSLLSFNGRNV